MDSLFHYLSYKLNQKQDPAGLGVARFIFGLLMIIDIFEERGLLFIPEKWGDPESCYFPLFDNLPRLSMEYMYLLYLVLLISATGIMLGLFYRWSCFCFIVAYWYLFFLDKTVWNNHSYLYGLLSILFFMTDAHHYCSVDSLIWPSIRNTYVPFWNYAIFKFQLFILYFFAGLKKLDYDWVSGYSMTGLSKQWIFDPFRMILSDDHIDFFMVHICGLVFDLSQGFLLLFDSTRLIGFILGYMFHGMNAVMFSIGMFSYACMGMLPIFCHPDWPKKIIRKLPYSVQLFFPSSLVPQENKNIITDKMDCHKTDDNERVNLWFSVKRVLISILLSAYVLIQLTLPFSHSLTLGYNSWTQGLYGYSWDMMVHSWSTQHVVIKVVDKVDAKKQFLRPGAFVPAGNIRNRIFTHPDMIKQYSLCLADRIIEMEELNISQPQIYIDVWKSLNGRYLQRMVDPHVDIVSAHWSVTSPTSWLLPLQNELTKWRTTLKTLKSVNAAFNNATDIVFVADFPGLFLENYIAPEIIANVTVLRGHILVEMDSKNISVNVNETLNLKSDTTHLVHTVSDKPSCYMYVYYNTTWADLTEEQRIHTDPVLKETFKAKESWESMPLLKRFSAFLYQRFQNYQLGVRQIYFALTLIFDVEKREGDKEVSDEL